MITAMNHAVFPTKFARLLILAMLLSGCSQPEIFVQEQLFFETEVQDNPLIEKRQVEYTGFKLNYAHSGKLNAPALVYLHGTPGGWDNGARYLMDEDLQRVAHVVAIDRPGWGGSQLADTNAMPDFAEQARLIKPLLDELARQNQGQGIILIGHSLGASLAPYIAMQYPQQVSGLILLAGSLDPQLGKPRWYNQAASMGVVAWFLSPEMKRANKEILPLQTQLETMRNSWNEIKVPVTVIHGMRDKLVFPANVDFAERELSNADLKVVRIETAGHFIPWENRDIVTREIYLLLEKIKGHP